MAAILVPIVFEGIVSAGLRRGPGGELERLVKVSIARRSRDRDHDD
jgi:hypothetical protein